jgi:hypothetical protein
VSKGARQRDMACPLCEFVARGAAPLRNHIVACHLARRRGQYEGLAVCFCGAAVPPYLLGLHWQRMGGMVNCMMGVKDG